MHRIRRKAPSNRLKTYLARWNEELSRLLRGINENNTSRETLALWKKKGKKLLKSELFDIFKGCCSYCEDAVNPRSAHIDHRLPRNSFPHITFDFDNLHYSCGACNIIKSNDYFQNDIQDTILDVCKDPVEEHIIFHESTCMMIAKTKRGEATIDICKLNDDHRHKSREELYEDIRDLLKDICRENISDHDREKKRGRLLKKARHGSPFCSVARAVIKKKIRLFPNFDLKEWEFELEDKIDTRG